MKKIYVSQICFLIVLLFFGAFYTRGFQNKKSVKITTEKKELRPGDITSITLNHFNFGKG
jgi:hypothetical protein